MVRQLNCNELKFALYPHAHEMEMYESYYRNGQWDEGTIVNYHDITLSPAANILNYDQGIFEGLKAFYSQKGNIILFRTEENAKRFERIARKLTIPDFPVEKFLKVVGEVVLANKDFIPHSHDGHCSLYIRPVCIGIEPLLGVRASTEYLFYIFASLVGPYFDIVGIIRLVAKEVDLASPHGTGDAKAVCNYPVTMRPKKEVLAEGFNYVIYLDPFESKYIEEAGAANFFALIEGEILVIPPLGSILPGIIRDSVISLARDFYGMKVEKRNLSMEGTVKRAKECFVTRTAAIITSVSHIGWKGQVYDVNRNDYRLAHKLYNKLINIQLQEEEYPFGWVTILES